MACARQMFTRYTAWASFEGILRSALEVCLFCLKANPLLRIFAPPNDVCIHNFILPGPEKTPFIEEDIQLQIQVAPQDIITHNLKT